MKLAVLSDIHGNTVALDAVIEDAKKNKVDSYIVAGDLITDFPGTNEIVEKIRGLTPYVIKGNREDYLEAYLKTNRDDKWKSVQSKSLICVYEDLKDENIEYIKSLPEQLSLNFEGLTIRVVHGAIDNISKCIDMKNQKEIEEVSKKFEEDILIMGHTHQMAGYMQCNGKTLINDGSVGLHRFTTKAQYVIIDYSDNKLQVQVQNVEYDKEKLKELIKKSELLKNAFTWMNLSYYDILYGKNIRTQFNNEAINEMHKRYNINETSKEEIRYSKFNEIDDDIYIKLSKKYEKYFLIK